MKAENLRARRIKLRCSQYIVAKMAGMTRNRLSLIECNYVKASSEEKDNLQSALNKIEEDIQKLSFLKEGFPT